MSGGRRAGAGRKALPEEEKRVNLAAYVSPATWRILNSWADARGVRLGRVVDELVSQAATR